MTQVRIAVLCAVMTLSGGCAAMFVNPRAVSIDDVIYLTKHKLASEVIIKHLRVTRSRFSLTTGDIVHLKDEGVDDEVIGYMVDLSEPQAPFEDEYEGPIFSFNSDPPVTLPFFGGYVIYNGQNGYSESLRLYSPAVRRDGLIGRFYDNYQPSFIQNYGSRRGIYQNNDTVERAEPGDDDGDSDE
jgi:hypothetical protein